MEGEESPGSRPKAVPRRSQGRGRGVPPTEEFRIRGPVSPGRPLEPRTVEKILNPVQGVPGTETAVGIVSLSIDPASGRGEDEDGAGAGDGDGGTLAVRAGTSVGRREVTLETFDYLNTRPTDLVSKEGTTGNQIDLRANYFPTRLTPAGAWALFHYHLTFPDQEDRKWVKKAILRDFSVLLGSYLFDGGSALYTARRLQVGDGNLSTTFQDQPVTIQIKLVAQIPPGDVVYLQFYNILVRKCVQALGLTQMGRNYFDSNMSINLDRMRLSMWPGFITTLRCHELRLLYGIEVTHKVIRMDHVLTLIREIRSEVEGRGGSMDEVKAAVGKEIVGYVVMTVYNKKTYRISAIQWDARPTHTFQMTRGGVTREITYLAYYKEWYDRDINAKQPLLLSKRKARDVRMGITDPIILVPELCQLTGLTDNMRQNFGMMREIGRTLFQPPNEKVRSIMNFVKRLRESEQVRAELTGWGIEIGPNPVSVVGRVLPAENIKFSDNQGGVTPFTATSQGDFTMAFRSRQMMSSVELRKWVLIVPQRDGSPGVDNLVRTMQNVARVMGFTILPETRRVTLQDVTMRSYARAIEEARRYYGTDLQMVFVILPNNKLETYAAVKKLCYVDCGLSSQCFLSKNVNIKGLMSIATKVVVQMNAKLGGEPWNVAIPLTGCMVVGFDVYHGGQGSVTPSIGAMVATTSSTYGIFFSTVSFFNSRSELSASMAVEIGRCLVAFRQANNGTLPRRIVFYRDGVGEGQLGLVFTAELGAIQAKLDEIYGKPLSPQFTFIVCTKRINTRLFSNIRQGEFENPPPGCVVDSEITLPERYDFFLIAQTARQGVVSPTSYNVLCNNADLTPDKIQRLTYKLCHLYFNWSGTVAVPAVVQYAHKLAYLTGMATQHPNHANLSHLLFFL